MYATLVLREKV